jgi:hypothetical protein
MTVTGVGLACSPSHAYIRVLLSYREDRDCPQEPADEERSVVA